MRILEKDTHPQKQELLIIWRVCSVVLPLMYLTVKAKGKLTSEAAHGLRLAIFPRHSCITAGRKFRLVFEVRMS
jgi:hypothetical protein